MAGTPPAKDLSALARKISREGMRSREGRIFSNQAAARRGPREAGGDQGKAEKIRAWTQNRPDPRPAVRRGHQTGGRASFMIQRKPPLILAMKRVTNGRDGLVKVGIPPALGTGSHRGRAGLSFGRRSGQTEWVRARGTKRMPPLCLPRDVRGSRLRG